MIRTLFENRIINLNKKNQKITNLVKMNKFLKNKCDTNIMFTIRDLIGAMNDGSLNITFKLMRMK